MTYPPLIAAIRSGSTEEVQAILSTANATYWHPPTAGKQNWTPLHFAAYSQNLPILALLLASSKHKPDITATETKDGFTPLHKAIEKGWVDGIKLLLEHGADIEAATTTSKSTPLMLAVKFGHLDAVRTLLNYNARVVCYNNIGMSPILTAAERGHLDILKLLWYHLGPAGAEEVKNDENSTGRTALFLATKRGHTDTIKFLISEKADVRTSCDDGWTPIHAAAHHGSGDEGLEVIKMLLEEGASLNARIVETGYTPLHIAAARGDVSYVSELVEAGAKLDVRSNMGYTPLYTAVRFGKNEDDIYSIVELLVKGGADLGVKDCFGMGVRSMAKQKGWKRLEKRAELY
ncbi:Ankyrin repeat and SOCS box containing [Orbilia blumenaviensis]|uniref:Ankyrin repeat and SOCS box containing n=1 Tax=Orbilia blumenaviensis TaxID=1796055 RepID=A0AAV9VEE6_9PEZI